MTFSPLLVLAVALTAVAVAMAAGVVGSAVRDRRRRRALQPSGPPPGTVSHSVEERVPASQYGRPARWVEVTASADRADADRRLAELARAHPQTAYRIVSVPLLLPQLPTPGPAPLAPPPAAGEPQPRRSRQETPPMTFTPVLADAPVWQRLRHHARTDDITVLIAQMLYVRILGPRGTDPTEAGDLKLVPFFLQPDGSLIDRDRLERHMSHFLMAALGGPKRYSGRGMAAAHADRWITDGAFDRVLGHMVSVLRELRVPEEWIGEIGMTVAPLRESIVTASASVS